ncbi:hypothetical protein SJS35_08475 [Aeromonas caviae]|jgi:hypothetical protein|uniref:hypothetical protein n=1 Tax=Aeromonas caviae TaxID=648 RepID=UPI0029DC3519|nr:hypothetical protein [Aeromonas caviae]MDX7683764.1 hypothetical protein [Aeromonas caviae]MDX7731551.1 hypothetical protein [Aeromonas caviae]
MIEITESGVTFGPFEEGSLYEIEKSKNLPNNSKPVEFVWAITGRNTLVLVEAKSSFSNPVNETDFNQNIKDICDKFMDSLVVMVAAYLRRLEKIRNELPDDFEQVEWSRANIQFRLVIPSFSKEWLPPINDKLRTSLKHFLLSFGIPVENLKVVNKDLALQEELLKPEQ